jgi:hypothetical protein
VARLSLAFRLQQERLGLCDRKVIDLQADESGMYTVHRPWTLLSEKLDVLTHVVTRMFLIDPVA